MHEKINYLQTVSFPVSNDPTDRGQRQDPLFTSLDEEIESHHLKFIVTPPSKCRTRALRVWVREVMIE